MRLKVLGSCSRGNSYILETDTGSLILDAGVPFRDIQTALDFNLDQVCAVLLTHIHNDHFKAIPELTKAGIDCFVGIDTYGTAPEVFEKCPKHRLKIIIPRHQIMLDDFIILPIDAQHDVPCLAYLIQYRPTGEKLLYSTDTFYLKNKFNVLNYIIVECNYCLDILKANIEAGLIPESLKNRLLESHFSLDNVKGFLKANDLSEVRKIVLCHISEGNGNPVRMVKEITELTGKDVEAAEAGKEIELSLYPF